MSIYFFTLNYIFINFLHLSLVRGLCMLLRIASARWFCEVPSIYELRPRPPPPTPTPTKKEVRNRTNNLIL